jgi:membrane protease YdiL (CAAX protease family)
VNTPEESAHGVESLPDQPGSADRIVEVAAPSVSFHANNPPWGLPQGLLTWLLSLIILIGMQLIITVGYISYQRSHGIIPNIEALQHDSKFIFFNVLGYFPIHLLTLLLAWAVVTQLGRFDFWRMIGWSRPTLLEGVTSTGLAVLLFGMAVVLSATFGGQETDIDRIVQSSRPTAFALAILAVATAPLVEEIIYRGVLYPASQRAIGRTGAIVLVAGLFAVGHVYQYWPNFGVISAIVLLSVALTMVRAFSGRLLPCFIIHFVFNGIQSIGIVVASFFRPPGTGSEPKAAAIMTLLHSFQHLL